MQGNYSPTVLKGVKVLPQGDRLIIRPDAHAGKTEGGILLPDNVRGKPTRGKIVAAGLGRVSQEGNLVPMTYSVGQEVLYAAFSETGITIDDEEFLILREQDIYAVVEPKPVPVEAAGT